MSDEPEDRLLDDLFHGCAFAAYVELAVVCGGVPDSDATRRLAYRHYKEELAALRRTGKTVLTE